VYFFHVTPVVTLSKTPAQESADKANIQIQELANNSNYEKLQVQYNDKNEVIGTLPNGKQYNLSEITKNANLYRLNFSVKDPEYASFEKVLDGLHKKQRQANANEQYINLREGLKQYEAIISYLPQYDTSGHYVGNDIMFTLNDEEYYPTYNLSEMMKEMNVNQLACDDNEESGASVKADLDNFLKGSLPDYDYDKAESDSDYAYIQYPDQIKQLILAVKIVKPALISAELMKAREQALSAQKEARLNPNPETQVAYAKAALNLFTLKDKEAPTDETKAKVIKAQTLLKKLEDALELKQQPTDAAGLLEKLNILQGKPSKPSEPVVIQKSRGADPVLSIFKPDNKQEIKNTTVPTPVSVHRKNHV
jgi:hypothetical protein